MALQATELHAMLHSNRTFSANQAPSGGLHNMPSYTPAAQLVRTTFRITSRTSYKQY